MPTLYHWTAPCSGWLGAILASGTIRLTESNFSLRQVHAGPPVVWLTSDGALEHREGGYSGLSDPKRGARLTVDPDPATVQPWLPWARERGADDESLAALARSGHDPQNWYVATRAIPSSRITGLTIYPCEIGGHSTRAATFNRDDLRNLFRSAGRRRAMGLIPLLKGTTP